MELESLLIFAIAGVFLGLPTGPSRFFVVGAYLDDGRNTALKLYSGILAALSIYAAVAIIASGFLSRNEQVEDIAYFAGSILLVFWGCFILFKGKKEGGARIKIGSGSVSKGFITALSSPVTPFVFLIMIQLLRSLVENPALWHILLHFLMAEICSGLTIFSIAFFTKRKELNIENNWKTAKIIMGIFLIVLGAFNLYQLLDFKNGLRIEKKEGALEKTEIGFYTDLGE